MRRPLVLLVSAALAVSGAAAVAHPAGATTRSPGKQPVAVGTGGAVASVDLTASQAGIQSLGDGGNAIDAAVAVAATLGATEPYVAGPGGGGFMVIYLAKTHQVVTIDGRENCPSGCSPRLFIDPRTNQPMPFEAARHSGLAVGVPGMVATWARAARLYGARSLASDLQPAIRAAQDGFRVDRTLVEETEESLPDLQAFTSSRKLFLTPDGRPLPVGTLLRNPDLARTYRLIAQRGPGYLYDGPLARAIARTVQHPPVWPKTPLTVRPGIMRTEDLASYVAKSPAATHVGYRGLDVYGMAPPSSGGSTVGEALNILSGYRENAEPRPLALHHYIEALRYAFADRNAYVGDPDYEPVPLDALLSTRYAATRRCLITDHAATSPVPPGDPFPPFGGCPRHAQAAATTHDGQSTNHIVTADRWGNVVSYTNTIEHFAGTGMTVPGYGFLLNNEMTDFDFAPPAPGIYDPNLAAPGKQPRSSMSPTIVLRDGAPAFTLGSPGGATIITTVLQLLVDHVDFGMSLPQAIAAPRVGNANTPTSFAEPAFLRSHVAVVLRNQFGQRFTQVSGVTPLDNQIGAAVGIEFLGQHRLLAAAEPVRRGGGSALVVHPTR